MTMPARRFLLSLALGALPWLPAVAAAPPTPIEMTAVDWSPADAGSRLRFLQRPGFPYGVLAVKGGGALLKGVAFADGTIEYDIQEDADNAGIDGIWFRQRDARTAEDVYLRIDSDCPRSVECVQYAPVARGNVQWDVYPEYEAGAPVKPSGWNHVKLVVSGARMAVFVNGERSPSLRVGRLEGDAATGALQLRGDALFANLTISRDVGGLASVAAPDPSARDPRYLRRWRLAPIRTWQPGQDLTARALPADAAFTETLAAERKGFVDLGRRHGTARGVPDLAWLKTVVVADRAGRRHVELGWARQLWIFVNGRRVFADANLYYPASGRKPPLGRMALGNGGVDLRLQAGANEIVVALADDLHSPSGRHWGWGFEWRFDDVRGLAFPAEATTASQASSTIE